MSKIRIVSIILASACVAAPAMAEDDFGALSRLTGVPSMSEAQLAAVEGQGGECTSSGGSTASAGGGALANIPILSGIAIGPVNVLQCSSTNVVVGIGVLGPGTGPVVATVD